MSTAIESLSKTVKDVVPGAATLAGVGGMLFGSEASEGKPKSSAPPPPPDGSAREKDESDVTRTKSHKNEWKHALQELRQRVEESEHTITSLNSEVFGFNLTDKRIRLACVEVQEEVRQLRGRQELIEAKIEDRFRALEDRLQLFDIAIANPTQDPQTNIAASRALQDRCNAVLAQMDKVQANQFRLLEDFEQQRVHMKALQGSMRECNRRHDRRQEIECEFDGLKDLFRAIQEKLEGTNVESLQERLDEVEINGIGNLQRQMEMILLDYGRGGNKDGGSGGKATDKDIEEMHQRLGAFVEQMEHAFELFYEEQGSFKKAKVAFDLRIGALEGRLSELGFTSAKSGDQLGSTRKRLV